MSIPGKNVTGFYDSIAPRYDEIMVQSNRVKKIRLFVRQKFLTTLKSGSSVLEIGCGTGTDAVFLASQGIEVTAIDISPEMIGIASGKIKSAGLDHLIRLEVMDAGNLQLDNGQLFDSAFSIFNALNHLPDLEKFAKNISVYLKPGARVHFVLLNRVCLAEVFSWMGKGAFRTAFRKLFNRQKSFSVYMRLYSPARVKRIFSEQFEQISIQSYGVISPPDPFSVKRLDKLDDRISNCKWLHAISDHYVISMTRK